MLQLIFVQGHTQHTGPNHIKPFIEKRQPPVPCI